MTRYEQLLEELPQSPKTWLITGVAGFIGSNLLETLLKLNQKVVGLDNFATGHQHNLDEVQGLVTPEQWTRFRFIEGDIRNFDDCQKACEGIDYVLHQAALGSVPRSVKDPITTNATNIDGFLNMLVAAKNKEVKNFIYAASSSTYGDHPGLPKVESVIGSPLSPYAITKYVNELYSDVFAKVYGFESTGLRYFNVFGGRQDPNGAYAAVIPKWISAAITGEDIVINGDGLTSRDFTYIDNVVQANILAATASNYKCDASIYNIAAGSSTSLVELKDKIIDILTARGIDVKVAIKFTEFRPGDVRHSLASIEKAQGDLGYEVAVDVNSGLEHVVDWYLQVGKSERQL